MTRHTILFLSATPSGVNHHALDREAHSIRAELKRSGHRDRFEFMTRGAAAPLDLLRELREVKPTVVHFSGRGSKDGLLFQAADGRAQVVSPSAIAETFSAAGKSVRLVVLSACYSEAPAEALLEHVDCVIGIGGELHEDAARSFAVGFYGALGDHESVAAAYRHGNAAICLEGLSAAGRPQLRVRIGCDVDQLVLATAPAVASLSIPCPYPGMRPYSADNTDHFHGRGAEIDELVGRLWVGEREIYVIGPSGSGKSSLVSAGVLPRLARNTAGLGPFLVRSMRPGEDPAARLSALLEVSEDDPATLATGVAKLLKHRGPSALVLILVDQLEELFTVADTDQRTRFLSIVKGLRSESRCVVIFTLRADFYGDFMESLLWTDRKGRISRVDVGPLRGEALREAISRPAHAAGVHVEPALTERLLADAGSEPGALPLLQETLAQLWDRRQDHALVLDEYRVMGDRDRNGLATALARRADAVLGALTEKQQGIARRILLRLIAFGEGRSDTRRQQPRSKLCAPDDDPAEFERVLQRMIADRLLVIDDDGHEACVDLAHEVMIVAWPTLASWLEARRRDEHRRRQLEDAATQWVARGRGASGLLDPGELAEVEAWLQTKSAHDLGEIPELARLVAASAAARDRQARWQRELEVARQIQRSLLPARVPAVKGLDFAVHYKPAEQPGGDFYDFIWHDPSHLGLAVGRVAGKGISAALYIARLTSELRSRAAIAQTPARLLRPVNREIAELSDDGMFATLIYCTYDLENRSLVLTNAGHCVPLLYRGDRVFPLQAERAHTPPLGVTPELEAGEARVQLHPGDMLILVSYGVLKTRGARGDEYGLSRLSRRILTARRTVDDVVSAIVADIDGHRGDKEHHCNDLTLVAMSIGRPQAERREETLKGVEPGAPAPTRLTIAAATGADDCHTERK